MNAGAYGWEFSELLKDLRCFDLETFQIEILKKDLFPNNSFQERQLNFSSFFNSNKKNFLSFLIEKIDPFNNSFNVVKY